MRNEKLALIFNKQPLFWLGRFFTSESNRSFHVACCLLLFIAVTIALLTIYFGSAPITGPWDVMVLLDGGWRIINGQVPHQDFHNAIGPLAYLLTAFGMKVRPPSTASIAYGNILLMALLTPWAWFLTRRRLSASLSFLFGLFVVIILTAPRPLGYPIFETSYAMVYNRQGYVLLSMLLITLFIPGRGRSWFSNPAYGLSCGAIIALLFYCKITYFMVGLAAVFLGVVLFRRKLSWIFGFAAGVFGVCMLFQIIFQINPFAYAADVEFAARSQSMVMRFTLLGKWLVSSMPLIYLLVLFLVVATTKEFASAVSARDKLRLWIITIFIVLVGQSIGMGNAAQGSGSQDPIFFAGLLILVGLYRSYTPIQTKAESDRSLLFHAFLLLVCLPFFYGNILIRDAASLSYSFSWKAMRGPSFNESRRLHSEALSDFFVPDSTNHETAYWLAREHPANINDGLDLLRKHLDSNSRIACIAFANPFSFALKLMPPRGGMLWWDADYSFSKKSFPKPEEFLGDATLIMIPKLANRSRGAGFATVDLMMELYGNYIGEKFHELDHTDVWSLLTRRGSVIAK